ncbi:hypothetical protein BKA80DRAFT_71897 [Phyllosticta citrichinensis]
MALHAGQFQLLKGLDLAGRRREVLIPEPVGVAAHIGQDDARRQRRRRRYGALQFARMLLHIGSVLQHGNQMFVCLRLGGQRGFEIALVVLLVVGRVGDGTEEVRGGKRTHHDLLIITLLLADPGWHLIRVDGSVGEQGQLWTAKRRQSHYIFTRHRDKTCAFCRWTSLLSVVAGHCRSHGYSLAENMQMELADSMCE